MPSRDPAAGVELPAYAFGEARKRRRGPGALSFPPDDELPLFFFKRDQPDLAAAAAELAAAGAAAAAEEWPGEVGRGEPMRDESRRGG